MQAFRRRGALLVTVPSLQESLDALQVPGKHRIISTQKRELVSFCAAWSHTRLFVFQMFLIPVNRLNFIVFRHSYTQHIGLLW